MLRRRCHFLTHCQGTIWGHFSKKELENMFTGLFTHFLSEELQKVRNVARNIE